MAQTGNLRRLLIRPGAIGDFIVSLPALESLRGGYTELWTSSPNAPLARFAGRVDSIASTGLDLLGIEGIDPPASLLDRLAGFDSIISWYGANRPEFRDTVAALALPFHFFPALPADGSHVHAVDFYLAQAGAPSGAIPRIPCARHDEGFLVIHPFSGGARKNWPLDKYRALAARLRIPVRWCAGPEEDLDGAVRIGDLYQLACWLARARAFLGNDSGIAHLAAAVGTPVVALFGPTDPAVWAPRGPHVRIVRAPGAAMENLAVDDVAAVISYLF